MDLEAIYKAPTEKEISSILSEKFSTVNITSIGTRRVFVKLPREDIFEVCKYIQHNLTFEHCSTVIGVDYSDYMQVIYHLSNYYNGVVIELSVDLPVGDLHIESVTPIWEGANWHERETYELFGIIFDNHPRLERLLTPDTYEFYPFRKSYKLRGAE